MVEFLDDGADLRGMIRNPLYRAHGRAADAYRTEVTRLFEERYPGPVERDLSGRMLQIRAYDRRRDQGGVEHVSAHQRGTGARSRGAPGEGAPARPVPRPSPPARPSVFVAPPLVLDDARAAELTEWRRQANAAFRHEIAVAEHTAQRSDNGYGDRREDWGAVGQYQMRAPALREIGWLPEGRGALRQDTMGWADRAQAVGANNTEAFLSHPIAQEAAFTAYLQRIERQLVLKQLWARIGQTVQIGTTSVEITAPGLVAAAHRVGADGVEQVLAGRRADLAGPVLGRLRGFGARDPAGNMRFPYSPLNANTPAVAPRRLSR